MNNIIKSPVISLSAYDIKSPKGKITKVSGRSFHSLTYRKQGTVKINIGDKTLISTAGCITLTPKKQSYSTKIMQDTHLIAIHFDCLDENMYNIPFVLDSNNQQLRQLFELVVKKYSTDDVNNYECFSYFYKILAEIEKHFRKKQESKIIPAILEAKSKIEKNFADNNFNIDSLVSELPISASYLRNAFKKAYSVSPIDYLKYVRQQNAISLLSSSYYSVEELAEKCGYSSASYFIQAFRKSTGYSPLQYKEKFLDPENE